MVVGPVDHTIQADIIFVIEGTAINGAYLNDLKSNYIIPTLEYFSQGTIEDYVCESTNTLYGIVTYQAADCLPNLSSDTYGPYTSPQKVLMMLEKIGMEFVGGKGESHANIAEGLATALLCFEDLQPKRDVNASPQKHCILVCNSPPYMMPVRETPVFDGLNVEQLAGVLNERNIHLSILSPRKIPALFKLYEKAGGDLPSQTKNYAKDPRHLVLLKGYSLKERPISPGPVPPAPHASLPIQSMSSPSPILKERPISPGPVPPAPHASLPIQSMSSPLPNINSPQQPQPIFKPAQTTPPVMLGSQQSPAAQPQPSPAAQAAPAAQTVAPARGAAPFPPGYMLPQARARWPMMPPQNRAPYTNTAQQGSALIAQLTQPPTMAVNPQFSKDELYFVDQQMSQSPRMMGAPSPGTQLTSPAQAPPTPAQPQQPPPQPQAGRERHTIWQGVLEWIEKSKTPNDAQKNTRHVPCQVSAHSKDGEPELKADSWPQKLIMQLMPKQLIGNIGGAYLKNSKSVLFHPQPCEALESLTKVMSSGFAGCVHFTSLSTSACDIKVLILLYTAEKRAYLGFIPNDQAAFVDRLRKVIQHQKTSQAMSRQGQGGAPGQAPGMNPAQGVQQGASGMGGPMAGGMQQQGGLMGRPMASMGQQQNTLVGQAGQAGGAVVSQAGPGGGGLMSGPTTQPATSQANNQINIQGGMQYNPGPQQMEVARKQNLVKIEQLRQTLEAAQQQEQHYKSQMEIFNHMKIQQLQQNLEQAQQQENLFKSQMEQEQQKHQLRAQLHQLQQQQQQRQITPQQQSNNAGGMAQQQLAGAANQQQMMRPAMSNNPGLRHLLQQPQYRQQMMGMQQMQRNTNTQQPFDDNTFDFLN
ncbi:mediator of RNA polymerase II transcription subunit 25-like [Macrosteles quadrilineatus]|uniref:mediator of RNA polymerase II transcription subunit 25-like n=1 Tax=Macrosteles quadrilineatus TaxID=74068 RepID=UPI0023E35018|nr:mediator of RNA polymerase II transcription subunit 25-like [Macrosteles quadrilineatus]